MALPSKKSLQAAELKRADVARAGEAFLAYIEQCLVPTLKRRDVVVVDNVPFHKVAGVEDAIQAVGASLRYALLSTNKRLNTAYVLRKASVNCGATNARAGRGASLRTGARV
jgi:hypothetical protein